MKKSALTDKVFSSIKITKEEQIKNLTSIRFLKTGKIEIPKKVYNRKKHKKNYEE